MFCSRNTWFIFILSIWLKHAQAILCYFASSAVPRFQFSLNHESAHWVVVAKPSGHSPLDRKRAIFWPLDPCRCFSVADQTWYGSFAWQVPRSRPNSGSHGDQLDCWKQTGGSSGAEHLVFRYVQLSGLPIDADNGLHFVQIFGKLAALGEHWCVLDLFGILTLDWSGSSTVFSNTGWSWLAFQPPWSRTKHPSYSPASSYPGDMNGVTCLSAASLVMTLWIPSG